MNRTRKKWKRIGIRLSYNVKELEDIRREHEGSDEMCWFDVMETWLLEGGTSSYPACWEGLYNLLVDSGALCTAKVLRIAVTQAIHPHLPPSAKAERSPNQQSKL